MFNKQFFREALLPLSVLVALLRLQWDPISQQHRVEIQGIQDIILGESAALTETQFHSWYSTYENEYVHIHPKSVDSGIYSRSIFSELHALNDRNRFLNLIPSGFEITTLLLDQEDLNPRGNLNSPSASHSETAAESDSNSLQAENDNVISISENGDMNNNMEVDGAIASPDSGFSEYQDISLEDMDLIEALWRQDIDMGITREDTYLGKTELELEKPKPIDTSDKLPQNDWQYSIDCETGEHLPIAPQVQLSESVPVVQSQASPVPDGSLSFEDCLSLLDGYNPETDLPNSRPVPQLVNATEIEQRWQDLASISELQLTPTMPGESNNVTSQNNFPNATWSSNLTSDEQNVFAYNATTNGNVNLQNATSPQLPLFNNISQPMSDNQLLTVDTGDDQIFSATNDTIMGTSTELFSPINRLNNMSISAVPSPASSQNSSVNLTMLMMEQQALDLPRSPESSTISPPTQNSSLLLELLNSTEPMADNNEMDSDMQELDNMLGVLEAIDGEDGTPMDLLSEDGSFSGGESDESVEGATGFNRDTFKGEFKKGYNRGGSSPCHSETGSTSSFDSSQHTDSIHHNHSYASSSDAGSQKSFRSSNSSKNSTSDDDFDRPSRDQKRATELNIPIPIEKIINLPVDNFNDLLKKYDFNSEQIQLIRDIRRRGKNKVAAQNCRKRKISAIQQVEGTVGSMQSEHDKLLKDRDKVKEELAEMRERFDELYAQVFQNMRDRNGDQVDPNQYRLEIMEDGSVILVPRNGTSASGSEHTTDKRFSSN